MKHTYLVEAGSWHVTGMLYSHDGVQPIHIEGLTQIVQQEKVWILDNKMRIKGQDKVSIQHRYAVAPMKYGQASVAWLSNNEQLGRLTGRFTFVEDTILSFFRSDDGNHFGTESFTQENEGAYQNRGALYSSDQLVSSWVMKLVRRT